MAYYNEYQRMHYFALYGKYPTDDTVKAVKPTETKQKMPKKAQLYNLTYRGNIVLRNAPYAACETKKRVLNANYPTNFGMKHFKMVKVKQTTKN